MKMLCFLVGVLLVLGCGGQEHSREASAGKAIVPGPGAQIQPFQNEDGTWGYDISLDGKPFIHQPHQPAIGGNKGFVSKRQAVKVGELVADKISRGIMPPSVTAAEVDSLIHLNN